MDNTANTSPSSTAKFSVLHWLDENFEKIFLVIGLLAIILFITLQTVYRYVITYVASTSGAMVWTEELSRYIFIWITYLALCVAIKRRSSIRVDIIYDKLPKRWQDLSWIVVHICFLVLTVMIAVTGWSQIERLPTFPQYTPAMRIPFLIPYLILPIGFGLMSIRLIQDICRQIKICGTKDSLIALGIVFLVGLPLYPVLIASYTELPVPYDYIPPLPVLFGYFVVLCAMGVPIAISLGLSALGTIICADTMPIQYIAQTAFTSIDSFPIMAIPFFIAAGVFMGAGGLSKRLLHLADEMLGGLYGGMGLTTVATCMFFGAISGSGPATVAAIGSLTIPAMIERGYDKYFAGALVAAAGCVGVMIPPSNPFVVYGVSAQVSIGDLFIGGIVPGILCGLVLMGYCYYRSRKEGWHGETRKRTAATVGKAFWDAKWALMVPIIVLGGIYGGITPPPEAGAIAVVYALFVEVFITRSMTRRLFLEIIKSSVRINASIFLVVASATALGQIMMYYNLSAAVLDTIMSISTSKVVIMTLILIVLLILGTFLEAAAIIMIVTPLLLPVVNAIGVDPVHFGIIMLTSFAVGGQTPPVGMTLFVGASIAKISIERLSIASIPYILTLVVMLFTIAFVPQISLCLI